MSPGLVLLACLLQSPPPAAPAAAAPTADALIARVHERYSHCTTFRDHARSRDGSVDELPQSGEEYFFAYARPDRFRFERGDFSRWEYRGEKTIWRERDDWRTWERRAAQPSVIKVGVQADCLNGSSLFESWLLPLLAVPDLHFNVRGDPWRERPPLREVARESIDGIEWWRIAFELETRRVEIWIGDGGSIRRIRAKDRDARESIELLDLAPEFDVAIAPEELALSPPRTIGVKPSEVMHVLMILGFVTMGTIGVLLGLRLHQTGRPFTISANLVGWFAVIVGGAEILGRFVDQIDLLLDWSIPAVITGGVIVGTAWPVLMHLRREFGFYVVGVDQATFFNALRAVTAGLELRATISAAAPKVIIDHKSFNVASRPTWSMFGLLTRERSSRPLLERLRPLVSVCFESDELPTNRHAGLRIIAWSSSMIVGAIVFGSVLFSYVDVF